MKIDNNNNYLQQSVFIKGDSLYRLIDPQGQSVFVQPREFTNLLPEIHAAEKSLDPKMLSAAKITFNLTNKTFKVNDEDFQALPNTPYKAPPSKPTIQSPPTQFEKQVQGVIGSNPRFKHLLFTENSAPNFRDLNKKDYDKIFITFQFNNTTSSLILDRKKKAAYFFDPLLTKNEQRDKLAFGLKFHFRQSVWSPFKTFVNESAHTHNSSDTEKLTLDFYKKMTKAYDVQAFFASTDSPQKSQPRSTIPTYGDGNCGLHAFGEIVTVGNTPQYKWTKVNPKELLKKALEKPIEDLDMQMLFTDAQTDYCERHQLNPSSSDIKDRYLASLTDSSEYTGWSEILLFAKFVAKKNVTFEGQGGVYDFGFEETIPIRHIPNKKNPKLSHWERVC